MNDPWINQYNDDSNDYNYNSIIYGVWIGVVGDTWGSIPLASFIFKLYNLILILFNFFFRFI